MILTETPPPGQHQANFKPNNSQQNIKKGPISQQSLLQLKMSVNMYLLPEEEQKAAFKK
jgi:hypothetical protein